MSDPRWATSAIGLPLAHTLVAHGHQVVGVNRHPAAANSRRNLWSSAVVADILDRRAPLAAAPASADAGHPPGHRISSLPSRYRHLARTNELRTRGTRNLLDLAQTVRATRFPAQSSIAGYGSYGRSRR